MELVHGDITDVDSLRRGMEGCDRVFHLAAYAKNWAPDRQTFFRMNVQGMQNVFAVAKELGIRRVVWTSTCVTLGPTPPGAIGDEDTPRITQPLLHRVRGNEIHRRERGPGNGRRRFPGGDRQSHAGVRSRATSPKVTRRRG